MTETPHPSGALHARLRRAPMGLEDARVAAEVDALAEAGPAEVGGSILREEPVRRLLGAVLAGSPYLPWEEPTTAVVFGGSPERVLLTMTEGKTRYRKGGETWPRQRLHSAVASARRRMLGLATPAAS